MNALAGLLLFVAWDGTDVRTVRDMQAAGELTNLAAVGEARELVILEKTFTKPSWSTILTPGIPWYATGVQSNEVWRPIPKGFTVFEILHARGVRTGYAAEKCRANRTYGNMCLGYRADGKPWPFVNVGPVLDYASAVDQPSEQAQTERCLEAIAVVREGFVFCHYHNPDVVGHARGGDSLEYRQALRELDVELARLIATGARIVVLSDHGFEFVALNEPEPPRDYRGKQSSRPPGFSHFRAIHAVIVGAPASVATGRDVGPWILEQFPE